jgi:hypothetical protein
MVKYYCPCTLPDQSRWHKKKCVNISVLLLCMSFITVTVWLRGEKKTVNDSEGKYWWEYNKLVFAEWLWEPWHCLIFTGFIFKHESTWVPKLTMLTSSHTVQVLLSKQNLNEKSTTKKLETCVNNHPLLIIKYLLSSKSSISSTKKNLITKTICS